MCLPLLSSGDGGGQLGTVWGHYGAGEVSVLSFTLLFQILLQSVLSRSVQSDKQKVFVLVATPRSEEDSKVRPSHLICSLICSATRRRAEATPSMTSLSFSSCLSTSSCSISGPRFLLGAIEKPAQTLQYCCNFIGGGVTRHPLPV